MTYLDHVCFEICAVAVTLFFVGSLLFAFVIAWKEIINR